MEMIKILRSVFAMHGLPEQCVSDNGIEFEEFLQTSLYHATSNGLAERVVQTFKKAMKKMAEDKERLAERLRRFLFTYRITPQMGKSPREMLMGRKLISTFDLVIGK